MKSNKFIPPQYLNSISTVKIAYIKKKIFNNHYAFKVGENPIHNQIHNSYC